LSPTPAPRSGVMLMKLHARLNESTREVLRRNKSTILSTSPFPNAPPTAYLALWHASRPDMIEQ
jgi:hypothetical protein